MYKKDATKEDAFQEYASLSSQLGDIDISRDSWYVHATNVSIHRIVLLFGNYTAFKETAKEKMSKKENKTIDAKTKLAVQLCILDGETTEAILDDYDIGKWSLAGLRAAITKKISGFDDEQIQDYYNSLEKALDALYHVEEDEDEEAVAAPAVDFSEEEEDLSATKWWFDDRTNNYMVHCPSKGGMIAIGKDKLESMYEAYSNFDGQPCSINEICKSFGYPRKVFQEIKKSMGWTHDSIPVTRHQLANSSEAEILEDLEQKQLLAIDQKLKKKKWQDLEKDAWNYRMIKENQLKPLEEFLKDWQPPAFNITYENIPAQTTTGEKRSILIGLSDLHFGKLCHGDLFSHKEWKLSDLQDALEKYCRELVQRIQRARINLDEIVIASFGDILDSLSGKTDKGTTLDTEVIGREQFLPALNTICYFIAYIRGAFPKAKLSVRSVNGNHDSVGDGVLFGAVEHYFFGKDLDIDFHFTEQRWDPFLINKNLIVMEHGYSPRYKLAKVPNDGPSREKYISNILLDRVDLTSKSTSRFFLMGDQHHVEMKEYNHFEFIMFPALGVGGEYEDHHGWKSKRRQKVLVFSEGNLEAILYHNFNK
jgi:hypothetical protein